MIHIYIYIYIFLIYIYISYIFFYTIFRPGWRLTAAERSRCWATPRVAPPGAWMSPAPRPRASACQRTWASRVDGRRHAGKWIENGWKNWWKIGIDGKLMETLAFSIIFRISPWKNWDLSKLPRSFGFDLVGRSIIYVSACKYASKTMNIKKTKLRIT